jgi:hypothetical protein
VHPEDLEHLEHQFHRNPEFLAVLEFLGCLDPEFLVHPEDLEHLETHLNQ